MGRYRPPDSDPRTTPFNASTSSSKDPTVRFELPFTIVCLSCEQSLAQATRYNARKTRAGNYYSTPIWHFAARCRHCQAVFVIATDPQNSAYRVVEGARKFVTAADAHNEHGADEDGVDDGGVGTTMIEVDLSQAKGRSQPGEMRRRVGHHDASHNDNNHDAIAQLEATTSRLSKQQRINQRTLQLHSYASARSTDPVALNAKLRSDFRRDKHRLRGIQAEKDNFREALGWADGAHVAPPLDDRESQEASLHFRQQKKNKKQHNPSGASTHRTAGSARDTLLKSVKRR